MMTIDRSPRKPHTLHVRQKPDNSSELEYAVTCPDPPSYLRPCALVRPCGCAAGTGADQRCPTSPILWHQYVTGLSALAHQTLQCYPSSVDSLPAAASRLGLAPGVYTVEWECPAPGQLRLVLLLDDRECVDEPEPELEAAHDEAWPVEGIAFHTAVPDEFHDA
jgi:hypothetical protein